MSNELSKRVYQTWQQAKSNIINGVSPAYLDLNSHPILGMGAAIMFNEDRSVSITPDTRNHISMSPEATVLIKKKTFSTFRSSNDLKFMDKTEKMLLRATKALFAYKVQQIRAYESLTKFENFFQKNNSYSLTLLDSFIRESSAILDAGDELKDRLSSERQDLILELTSSVESLSQVNDDILSILKRNAFSEDSGLTTWIVDPESPENYTIGPGTGVIELTMFTGFQTSVNYDSSPSSASLSLTYPYNLGTIYEEDIEIALQEALKGTLGLFSDLLNGGLSSESLAGGSAMVDGSLILSSALEIAGENTFNTAIDTNYIRERLRTFYLGKSFISASDIVHFYIRGNRAFEDYSFANSKYSEEQTESPFDQDYLSIDETILKAEYNLYTNNRVDYEAYKQLRSKQDNSFGMIHVFAGLVTDVTEKFSGGYWDLSVSIADNMTWLNWSRFQSEPSLTDPKNILEDPLTPFEYKKDDQGTIIRSSRDLLYENKQLLQSGLLSYDSGLLAGQNASEGNLIQGQYNGLGSLKNTKIIQHPSGFVYRWKEGITTQTAGFSVSNPTQGEDQRTIWGQNYQPLVTNGILNNLDIPNILSVLVVGQPYNIETFIEQAYTAHNITDKSGRLSQIDPFTGVLDSVRKQNIYYGNFQPYRMLTMSSATTQQILNKAGIREQANINVQELQKRKREVRRQIRNLEKSSQGAQAIIQTLQNEIDTIDVALKAQVKAGYKADKALTSQDRVGIQISLGGSTNLPLYGSEEENNDVTRAMMLVGAQRKIEDVRLNRDRNLFIVSDQYDSADIRPFILALNRSGWKLFEGKYSSVFQMCKEATDYLHLEFFANSQGHLEFRPPLWNRIPLTILKDIIRRQEAKSEEIIPKFITDLFSTRIEALYLQIHTYNVKIALAALMLGRYPDNTLIPNVRFTGPASFKFFGIEFDNQTGLNNVVNKVGNNLSGQFYYTRDDNGEINGRAYNSLRLRQTNFESSANTKTGMALGDNLDIGLAFQEKGDVLQGNTETLLGTFDAIIQEQSSLLNDIENIVSSKGRGVKPAASFSAADLNAIRDSFKRNFGRDPAEGLIEKGASFTDKNLIFKVSEQETIDDVLLKADGIAKKLNEAISNRDALVSMLQANIQKSKELEEIKELLLTGSNSNFEGETANITTKNQDDVWADLTNAVEVGLNETADFLAKSANGLQAASDILTGKMAEGTVYDHLIEDDTRNLLGYGSGKRYIIKDEYITSATFREQPPSFTRLDAIGNASFVGDGLQSFTDNLYFWAGGTDFDLWKQYGYKYQSKSIPFINDPESQGKPYVMLELAMQKIAINAATVNIIGNEFYQPGDTVYLPSKGMLYYVKSVTHSFSYGGGGSFATSLDLVYGHPPGNYIPGPLDVIGQQLVANIVKDPAIVYRSDETDDNYRLLRPDSSLVFPTGDASAKELLAFADNQVRFTNMVIDATSRAAGTNYLLIRGFAENESDEDGIKSALEKIAIVKDLFKNPRQLAQANQFSLGDDVVNTFGSLFTSTSSFFGGGSTGTTKTLKQMRLPNNLPVIGVPSTKIIEQVSYLKRDKDQISSSSQIRCLDKNLAGAMQLDAGQFENIPSSVSNGIFPKGGPRQSSWLDLRDEISGFNFKTLKFKSNVVEVGIITIPGSLIPKEIPG